MVGLTTDLPEHGLHAHEEGTVVMVYGGGEAYEVEFERTDGQTVILTLPPEHLEVTWIPPKSR